MKYAIELIFNSALHIGSDNAGYGNELIQGYAHSDTIFSALINTLAEIKYELKQYTWLDSFLNYQTDTLNIPFTLSSFGFVDRAKRAHKYYLPKPFFIPKNSVSRDDTMAFGNDFKKRKYISLGSYLKICRGEKLDLEELLDEEKSGFYIENPVMQNVNDRLTAQAEIYTTGLSYFNENINPYIIVDLNEDQCSFEEFKTFFLLVGKNGLGGRRTSGKGIFTFTDYDWFCIDLETKSQQRAKNPCFDDQKTQAWKQFYKIFNISQCDNPYYYLFSLFFPANPTIHSATIAHDLVQRKGWIFSTSSSLQLKRKTCFMFAEGSVFNARPQGKLVNITPDEFTDHNVFRSGLPLYMPYCEAQ